MIDDAELLRQYATERSDVAFAELVRRHVDLVYSVALRMVGGDAHAAEDRAQAVFVALARQAASLRQRETLVLFGRGTVERVRSENEERLIERERF